MTGEFNVEKSSFQRALASTSFSSFETGFVGPELEALAQLRQEKKFLGDLFKPERKVLYGADALLLSGGAAQQALVQKSSVAFFRELNSYSAQVALHDDYCIVLCERHDLSFLFTLAASGADACLCSTDQFDGSGLQYFIEWCRDLRVSPIWLVNSEQDLRKVVESDSPYAAFYFDEEVQDEAEFVRRVKLRRGLSPQFIVTCFYRSKTEAHLVRLARVGFDCYVEL